MKFIITKSRLLEALVITGKCISKGGLLPILESYLFTIENQTLTVTGSNLEVFLSKQVTIEGDKVNSLIALPAARLIDLVRELSEQPLMFVISEAKIANTDYINVSLTTGSGTYNFQASDGKDYPAFPKTDAVSFTINGEDLLDGINRTVFACKKETESPLSGVLVSFDNGKVSYTGCNGGALSTCSFKVDAKSLDSFIIPTRVLSILQVLNVGAELKVMLDKKGIIFQINETTVLMSRLFDGQYPDYKAIIPTRNNNILTIDRAALSGSLKRVTMFSEGFYHKVNMVINEKELYITSENSLGETAQETLNSEYVGEEISIGMDGKFLLTCLSKLSDEQITISFSKPTKPVLIREKETAVALKSDLMLIMPIPIA